MGNLGQPNQEKILNKHIVILIHSFNIIFRRSIYFRVAQNSQYFFSDYLNSILFGYRQLALNRQLKMMKKYLLPRGNIVFLDKINEFFLSKSLKLELWEFDNFHKSRVHQKIHEEDHCIDFENLWDNYEMEEIGINQNENILVFQMQMEIIFFHKGQEGLWNREQKIARTNYHQMKHIRFNQSNDLIVAQQVSSPIVTQKSREYYLIIIHKNQYGIWQTTHHIQGSLNPFYFIDDKQFLLFQFDEYSQFLSQIFMLDHNAQVIKKFSFSINQFLAFNQLDPPLIEIKSKNLVLMDAKYIFSLKKSNLLWQLSGFQKYNILQVSYAKNSEFLFFKLSVGMRNLGLQNYAQ